MKRILLYATTLFFLLSFNAVTATPYDLGKNASTDLARTIWINLGRDCTEADEFLRMVLSSVDRTKDTLSLYESGKSLEEWGKGYIKGFENVLEAVRKHCQMECAKFGKTHAIIAAKIFCMLAEKNRTAPTYYGLGKDTPNIICGGAYRNSCEGVFLTTARQTCQFYAQGEAFRNYYLVEKRGCCGYDPEKENSSRNVPYLINPCCN